MSRSPDPSRRRFLGGTLATGAALSNPVRLLAADPATWPVCVFNKPLQHLGYEAQASLVAEMGFAGIEGTVRNQGHVEPEKVEVDLPRQIRALRDHGVEMTLMTTDVNDADSELHRKVLRTAAEQGVKRFRMGAIKYDSNRAIPEQVEGIRRTFEDLVAFCKPLGIQPLCQNHAGAGRFGAGLWDLYQVLRDFDPADAGVAFDIRHATVEGGQSWPTEFRLLRPWFGMVYCKDFVWEKANPRPKNVPLGTGQVDYPRFLRTLHSSRYTGPISLHMEYKDHRDPSLLEESIEAIRLDHDRLIDLVKAI